VRRWPILAALLAFVALPAASQAPARQLFQVSLDRALPASSGRLIIVARPATGEPPAVLSTSGDALVAARDVDRLAPGEAVTVDADDTAFPTPFSAVRPGDYFVQAILDADRNYAYQSSPSAGDFIGPVVRMSLPGPLTRIPLSRVQPRATPPWDTDTRAPANDADRARFALIDAARPHTERLQFRSALLSGFWGRPTDFRAYVLTPPRYETGRERYPAVYRTEGFGANFDSIFNTVIRTYDDMRTGKTPPMIFVFLDHSGPTGTHEFADGVNNGPVGRALTEELIPDLERRYRMDARPSGRFLTGHSSGGWAALWLQVKYPKIFGGTWPTAPDPTDFHDFTNIDIYAAGANAYRRADGSPIPLVRRNGQVTTTFEAYTKKEEVLGPVGGQQASFDWVFSPRGPDGRPMKLIDRQTGAIDSRVAAYWRENYDIAHIVRRDWTRLKPDLDGKIHLIVGTADTFHLDGSARRLKAVLDGLGARTEFRFIEGRDHGNVLAEGTDTTALLKQNYRAMYAVARPGARR